MKHDVERSIAHILETNDVRKAFWHMDEKVADLILGIRQGDDAIVVGDLVINMEGPYPLKTARKTGLIHTCSDIVVTGGRPLFALNSMQVDDMKQAGEVSEDLKKQSDGLGVPMVGGNTQMENDLNPCVSFVVIGKLINEPIPDSGMQTGDKVYMLGEVVEGETGERVHRAKVKFKSFMEMLEVGLEIHAAKDCSRGGWFGNLTEMLVKARKGIDITSIPYPRISRYMGTYFISIPEKDAKKAVEIATKNKCPIIETGTVKDDMDITIGGEVYVGREKMDELVKGFPYRKPRSR